MNKNTTKKYLGSLALLSTSLITIAQEKPNVVLIMADDMGYSDIGCYGSEISTPNLDRLAEDGLRYSHFYNGARSCPSRAALVTGLYAHQAGIGWMIQAHEGQGSYEGDLSRNALTIAEYLKEGGYRTYMTGKWHLTSYRKINHKVKDNWPASRGFDRSFGIIDGAANYFTPNLFSNYETYKPSGDFYLTDAISDTAAVYIKENGGEDPFFLYVAYNAPHWPLHAKSEDIEKYENVYDIGWDQTRENRLQKQKEMDLFDDIYSLSTRDTRINAWANINANDKIGHARRMQIYAAQIDAMDQGIGRIIDALEDTGQLNNTIILFLSDNGACAEPLGNKNPATLTGTEADYESYRIHWANVSSTPFREYKHHAHEGGIATPLVVHWPNGISQPKGSFVRTTGHIIDIFKTIEDITQIPYPSNYNDHEITPLQGESLYPDFIGEEKVRGPMFWEHEGNLAVRVGEWKMVVKTYEGNPVGKLELYNMAVDPIEENDLANIETDKLQELWEMWYEWAVEKEVFPIRTNFYAEREQEDKRYPNGEFDYKTAGWEFIVMGSGKGTWVIDDTYQISGQNSSKVTVQQTGSLPNNLYLKWANLRLKQGERCKVRFKAKADKEISMKLRLEKDHGDFAKVIDKDVIIGTEIRQYEYNSNIVPADLKHQIGFYVGHCPPCTVWFDDLELSFINSPSLSKEWDLLTPANEKYQLVFDGSTTETMYPIPIKVSLRNSEDSSILFEETVALTNDVESYSIDVPESLKGEKVYVEFEYPPYAATACIIDKIEMNLMTISSVEKLHKEEMYQIRNIGNAVLVKSFDGEHNFSIRIYNASGDLINTLDGLSKEVIIPILQDGVYIIKVSDRSQIKQIAKIKI